MYKVFVIILKMAVIPLKPRENVESIVKHANMKIPKQLESLLK